MACILQEPGRILADLKACSRTRNLEKGKQLHVEAVKLGHGSTTSVANALIKMYARCGRLAEARLVFDSMHHPNVASWTALLLAYAVNGQGLTSLELFVRMKREGLAPDSVTFVAALKACTSLAVKNEARSGEWGKQLHNLVVENVHDSNMYIQNCLIDMYARCNSMDHAQGVFDTMQHPNVVSWTVLILGYADNGDGLTALNLFASMKTQGPAPDSVALVAALKACTSLAVKYGAAGQSECRKWGKEIHDFSVEIGCATNIYVQNILIDMYAKCGNMVVAHKVFECMRRPDVVSWTALIMGYAENGQGLAALDLYKTMKSGGTAPNPLTLVAALKACTSLVLTYGASGRAECRDYGKQVHNFAVENRCDSDIYLRSSLIDMYSKCESMEDARQVFDTTKHPSIVCWNALILGYAENGQGFIALQLFTRMKNEGVTPDSLTFAAALNACTLLGALESGRTIHSEIQKLDMILVNCLVDFYAKCGSLVEAQTVFDLHVETRDVITWNALLAGFSSCGHKETVFRMFQGMQDAGFVPDGITFLCILTCCSHAGLVERGREYFDAMSTKYKIVPNIKHYNCMVDIYGRANKLDDAMSFLQHITCSPNGVTWKTILGACRKWKNVEMGRLAFQCLTNSHDIDAYVLMGQIYGSRGMLQEQEMVMAMRKLLKTSCHSEMQIHIYFQ